METKQMGIIAVLLAAGMFFAGLGTGYTMQSTVPQQESLVIDGSTTVFPVALAAATPFMNSHANVAVSVSSTGSGPGITAAGTGMAHIGMASRPVKASENATYNSELKQYTIAADGIAVIVNGHNNITELNTLQIAQIFNGSITTWDALGSNQTGPIIAIGRETGSGTRDAFEELVLAHHGLDLAATVLEQSGNSGVRSYVENNADAIGYVGLAYLYGNVNSLTVNGTQATATNIRSGAYPIARNLYLVTRGIPTGTTLDFINFIFSPGGQAIIASKHYIPIAYY